MRFRSVQVLIVITMLCVTFSAWRAIAGQATTKWPAQFPREGATKIFENDRVIVWEQVWPKNIHMHKHLRDILVFTVEGGDVKVVTPDGKETTGNLNGGKVGWLGYYAAGLGPHAEVAVNPAKPPKAIFVELKGTEAADCKAWSLACE